MYLEALNGCCGIGEITDLSEYAYQEKEVKRKGERYNYSTGKYEPWEYTDYEESVNSFDAEEALKGFSEQFFSSRGASRHPDVFVFSEVSDCVDKKETAVKYGELFAKAIRKLKLGSVVGSKPALNPNHAGATQKHFCRAYVWNIDRKALQKWYKKAGKAAPKKDRNRGLNAYDDPDW